MTIKEFFTDQALFITHELRDNLRSQDKIVTGKTADSINFEILETPTKTTFQIIADKNLVIQEQGRGPTKNPGPGQVKKSIKQWIKDKGIRSELSDDSLAFLISRKIHREGFKGTPGLISSVINEKLAQSITDGVSDIVFANELEKLQGFAVNYNKR
jgi:hypothetical protein